MAKETILIVDDEEDILELVRYNLSKEGYHVLCAATGEIGLSLAKTKLPDLIVLDLMLPGIDGLEVCKTLKANSKTSHIPILMLTAKGEDSDIVTGLEVGADDYVAKPFSPKVLVARIRSVFRRKATHSSEEQTVVKHHDIVIDPGRHEVLVKNKPVELTYVEFRIFYLLIQRPGTVFSRYQIVDAIRGSDYPVTDRSVDVQIVSIRKKLGSAGKYIQTVRGVGYKFKD
jgi:two-component system, OmpR family, alkaline phosphatase synthesis response regulator PhoP